MINYSNVMRGNPADKTEAKKAFATAQYSEIMDLNKFATHIASHGCVYSRADITAVLTLAVDCIREQLLAGQKIQLGELGAFCVSLVCKGAESAEKFNPDVHITKVKVRWVPGSRFEDLTEEAEFNLVATRAVQAKVNAALKSGATSVDISSGTSGSDTPSQGSGEDSGNTGGSTGGNTGGSTGGDSGVEGI